MTRTREENESPVCVVAYFQTSSQDRETCLQATIFPRFGKMTPRRLL